MESIKALSGSVKTVKFYSNPAVFAGEKERPVVESRDV